MPALDLSLSLAGDVQLNRTLIGISTRGTDFRPAWQAITDRLLTIEGQQFASEGAYGSTGWPALAPSTIERRQSQGYGAGPILDMTGALKRSLSVKGAEGQISVIEPASMAFGTGIEYAGLHQTGTGRMPARKPLELPERDRKVIVKIAQRYWTTGSVS